MAYGMRNYWFGVAKDGTGRIIPSCSVTCYLAETSTLASIYTSLTGTTVVNSVTASSTDGSFEFWVDRFDYDSSQKFTIILSKPGYTSQTIENINIDSVVLGNYTISADLTVTTDIYVPSGVLFSVASGKTLTLNGIVEAGPYQIFTGDGTVTVGTATILRWGEWWGTSTTGIGTRGQTLTSGGSATQDTWQGMTTQGDIEYHSGTTRTRLAAGTAGYVLKTQGVGANPAWANNVDGFSGLLADDQHVLDSEVLAALPFIDSRSYATLELANTAAYNAGKLLVIAQNYTLTANTALTSAVKVIKGGSFTKASTYTLTINGPFEAGLYQVFSGFSAGDVIFGAGSVKGIYPEWFGAKGDDSTDCTSAFAQADATAFASRFGIFKPRVVMGQGVYRVTSTPGNFALTLEAPLTGVGTRSSIIKNIGTGSVLRIKEQGYGRFSNFTVQGNASSEDGIWVGSSYATQSTYMHFSHVDSVSHGRDGLVVVHSWGTHFFDCKFYDNGGLGVRLLPDAAHPSTKNAIIFRDCEARWNGGVTNNTGVYTKGGVLITNANGVYWLGGVVEGNNAWGFIIGTDTGDNILIAIRDVFMEKNPPEKSEADVQVPTTIGGCFYVAAKYKRVEVSNNYVAYGGIRADQTGYGFYVVDPLENNSYFQFKEYDNYVVAQGGAGQETRDYGLAISLVDNASTTITFNNMATLLSIGNNNTGYGALFFVSYLSSTITALSDLNAEWSLTDVDAGKLAIFKGNSSNIITIKNYANATRSLTVDILGRVA